MSPMTAANEGERKPLYITWAKKAPNPKHVTLRPRRERASITGKIPLRCWLRTSGANQS
jgi:hypothetical protein